MQHIYTVFAFMMGWSLFAFDDMGAFGNFFVSLFGAKGFADGLLFIISIAALVTDSYNPFLYFRF